jgi:hypothetical protein
MCLKAIREAFKQRTSIQSVVANQYFDRMELALGRWPAWVLWAGNANLPNVPFHFDPQESSDIRGEYERHVEKHLLSAIERANASEPDFGVAFLAAGLLCCGHLKMAGMVLDNWVVANANAPAVVLPMMIYAAVIPVPKRLCDCGWHSARVDRSRLRQWLDRYESNLQWDENAKRFILIDDPAVSDEQRIADIIQFAERQIAGSLSIWGDCFGRPHDNIHTILNCAVDGEKLVITMSDKTYLTIMRPAGADIMKSSLTIKDAEEVLLEYAKVGCDDGRWLRYTRGSSRIHVEASHHSQLRYCSATPLDVAITIG